MRPQIACLILTMLMALPVFAAPSSTVVVSVQPLALLLEELVDDRTAVEVLVDPAESSHHFSLKPSDMRTLQSARHVFWLGPTMEAPLQHIFEAYPDIPVTALLDQDEQDPHVWLDPVRAGGLLLRMSGALQQAGLKSDQRRLSEVQDELAQLDQQLAATLAPYREVPFIVLHDAWSHFVGRYELNQIGRLPGHNEHGASARAVSTLRQTAIDGDARCLIVEPAGAGRLADIVTRGTDIQVLELDPTGRGQPLGRGSYAAMMRNIAVRLADCLAG